MKKKNRYLAICGGFLLLICSSAVYAITISVVPANQTVTVGAPAFVDLVISGLGNTGAPSVSTFDVNVIFDDSVLAIDTSDTDGNGVIDSVVLDPSGQLDVLGLGGNFVSATVVAPGILNLFDLSLDDAIDLDTLQEESFTLATISFGAIGVGTSPLGITINSLGDANGNPLMAATNGGTVTVSQTTTVSEPSILLLLSAGLASFAASGRRRPA